LTTKASATGHPGTDAADTLGAGVLAAAV